MGKRDRAEITEGMVDAGLAVLAESMDVIGDAPDRDMIREIYLAMVSREASEAPGPARKGVLSDRAPPQCGAGHR